MVLFGFLSKCCHSVCLGQVGRSHHLFDSWTASLVFWVMVVYSRSGSLFSLCN